jgi:L-seryl-tRNA(Ser) seleniumtransferase
MDLKRTVNSDPRRSLPSVDRLIRKVTEIKPGLEDWAVQTAARETLAALRADLSRGEVTADHTLEALAERAAGRAEKLAESHPRRVVNATGVVIHTNLGRAPLSAAAQAAVAEAARGYSNLELDLETGRRGSRMGQLEAKLIALSGAEAAHVVNNCAAALLLALNTMALGKEVLVSRGELVEIGGSFRVPAIMERAGVRLREVGTTNRTHLSDYAGGITADTALLLKVHRSNFEQRGFTAEADIQAMAELAHQNGLPLFEDLGSGTLIDLRESGFPDEAHVRARLELGVDVLCFSGDKLLGGPQAGILVGSKEWISAMRTNPLARALRIDKLTVAALDATLDLLLDPERAGEVPVVAGLRATAAELEPRAQALRERIAGTLPPDWTARVEASESAVGGGSLPEHRLPGSAVVLTGPRLARLARRLREAPTPLLARLHEDALWLDVRTIRDDEFDEIVGALMHALH